jgi:hypothetical protein
MGGGGSAGGSKARREEDGGRDRRRERDKSGMGMGVEMGMGTGAEEGDEIRCRCGSSADDGFFIACDVYCPHRSYSSTQSHLSAIFIISPSIFNPHPPLIILLTFF